MILLNICCKVSYLSRTLPKNRDSSNFRKIRKVRGNILLAYPLRTNERMKIADLGNSKVICCQRKVLLFATNTLQDKMHLTFPNIYRKQIQDQCIKSPTKSWTNDTLLWTSISVVLQNVGPKTISLHHCIYSLTTTHYS